MIRRIQSVFHAALIAAVVGTAAGLAAADQAVPAPIPVTPQTLQAKQVFRQNNPNANFVHTDDRVTTVYGEAFSRGDSARQSAESFRTQYAGVFGAVADDLLPISPLEDGLPTRGVMWQPATNDYKFTLLYYTQQRDNWPVFRAELRLLARNEPGFPLVLAKSSLRDLGAFHVPADINKTKLSDDQAWNVARDAWKQQAGVVPMLNIFGPVDDVIWAGYDQTAVAPALARQFIAQGPAGADGVPQKWLFVVDAQNGALLYSEDQVLHTDVVGTTHGMATDGVGADICHPEVDTPLPYVRVAIGATTAFSDALGNFTVPNAGTSPVTVTAGLRGRWFRVFGGTPVTSVSLNVTPPGPANFLFNSTNASQSERDEVNSYLSANTVRDFTLSHNPAYPVISTQSEFTININVAGTCNAFYDGPSINFYPPGGGCPSTAFSNVVYHEYGHHLVSSAGSGQGAYGEGMGDVMGVLITDDPVLGRGFQSNCAAGIRNAANGCQYIAGAACSTCGSEIHSCGQLISGCVYSTRQALASTEGANARTVIANLAINAMLLHSGTTIGPDIPIDYITLDDNDGDAGNGSPHYNEISTGFSAHGLPPPELQFIGFAYPDGRPALLAPNGGNAFRVQAAGINGNVVAANSAFLHYSIGGPYINAPMASIGTNLYQAAFPPIPCGTVVHYYISAQTTSGMTINNPASAPATTFVATSATGALVVLTDDLETNTAWTVGAPGDNATTGIWLRADPIGTDAQPENDHTPAPGVNCFVTGNAPAGSGLGQNDVDDGTTSLISPVFNLSTVAGAKIGYWRWYSNDTGGDPNNDVFVVQVSNNGGSTWVTAETVGPAGPDTAGGWIFHEFYVADFVTPTANVRVKFVASDLNTGSLVEAAIDDFRIDGVVCGCPADFNGNGAVTAQDIFDFLGAFFGFDPRADFNHDLLISPQDIFDFLAAFFAPCP